MPRIGLRSAYPQPWSMELVMNSLTNKLRSLLPLAVLFGIGASLSAQIVAFPSWYNQGEHYAVDPQPIPQLSTANQSFMDAIHSSHEIFIHGCVATSFIDSGTLAVTAGIHPVAGIDTGLDRVLWLVPMHQSPSPYTYTGFVVGGLDSAGNAKVRATLWDASAPLSSISLQDVVPSTPGKVFLVGSSLDGALHVFDALVGKIEKYVDSNGDGLTDASSGLQPLQLEQRSATLGIQGFNYHSGGVYLKTRGARTMKTWCLLKEVGGAIQLEVLDSPEAIPAFFTNHLVAGMDYCLVTWKPKEKFEIKTSTGEVIGAGRIPARGGVTEVSLDRALKSSDLVHIETSSGVIGPDVFVFEKQLFTFPILPHQASLGDTVTVYGNGFKSSGMTVEYSWGDTGQFAPATFAFVDGGHMTVTIPSTRPPLDNRFIVRTSLVDVSGAVVESVHTSLLTY